MRGTFANVRIKNLMLPPNADGSRVEGGIAVTQPGRKVESIYDAAMSYIARGTPTVIFAGEEYGTGSSRDWAAKGTQLLGVRAVIARASSASIDRISSSWVFCPANSKLATHGIHSGIDGTEEFDLVGLDAGIRPQMDVTLAIRRRDSSMTRVPLLLRIDTPIEVDYYLHGGILPFVLRELLAA